MPRLLITGGAGFIGTNFVRQYLSCRPHAQATVVDALHYAGRKENLADQIAKGQVKFIEADICDVGLMRTIIDQEQIDTVINFAAHTHVDKSIIDPQPFYRNNTQGVCSLLQAATDIFVGKKRGGRFHQVSTDEVYGSLRPGESPWHEEAPLLPNSPYAASKAAAEHFVRAFAQTYGLNTTISRCSNNYGPYQYPEKLIPLALSCLLKGNKVPVYGDGLQRRDWLYVSDHVRALELILERCQGGEIYNIAGGCELTNLELLKFLCQALARIFARRPELFTRYPDCRAARGVSFEQCLEHTTDRKGHDRRYALNDDRIKSKLGFVPVMSFAQGLDNTVLWYIDHEKWLKGL